DGSVEPSQLVIDWIHDLLYLVVDQSEIVVGPIPDRSDSPESGAVYRTASLISVPSRTIKKLAICPRLSQLVWHELEWTGDNLNHIRVTQQDGTEPVIIHTS